MKAGTISKRAFLKTAAAAALAPVASRLTASSQPPERPANIILICADDLGSGDLGFLETIPRIHHPLLRSIPGYSNFNSSPRSIPTPNLDRMAREGTRLTEFNAASPVCSPSRAALLTGRYPTRVGVPDVLFPSDTSGLSGTETTIAGLLKPRGYSSMCIGKWHLGSRLQYLPTNRGFDEFFGSAYSHDMSPLTLMHNTEVIDAQVDPATLTSRCTEEAVKYITRAKRSPFFLYFAHFLPHIPPVPSDRFRGKSAWGPYGDMVEELDWSVGQVLDALAANGIDQNTLVMFTSDHGPWYQGSAGNLHGRKGETYEGGVRAPFIARFPGKIPGGGVSRAFTSNMDILPTVAGVSGAGLPGKPLDGIDIWPLLAGTAEVIDRQLILYFDSWNIQCARLGAWKLHVARYNSVAWGPAPAGGRLNLPLPKPELYNLEDDPGENYDLAETNPQIVSAIQGQINALLPFFPDQVRHAWTSTRKLQVEDTPSGALPILKIQ